jgi:FAD/FMN-containing dehydrogenase
MSHIRRARRHTGMTISITSSTPLPLDLGPLRAALDGAVHAPGDASWDDARRAWNLAVDQRPLAVAEATSADDVAAAVGFAAARGLRVAPQRTGHAAAALGPLDDVLLLRTRGMDQVTVDPGARRARAGAGALWRPVVDLAAEHGLAALHGSSGGVGVAGYTLGGGIGWLAREHGLAANAVTAIDVVTADGEQRRVEAGDDLFWALRGGGGGFGVVTALEFGLVPLTEVYAGALFWPGAAAADLLAAYLDWAARTPEQLTSIVRLLRLPPLPAVPEPLRGVPVIAVELAFTGDPAEGEALVQPLRAAARPLIDTLATVPATALTRLHGDPEEPVPGAGHQCLLGELDAAAVTALLEIAGPDSGSPLVNVELRQLGGALSRAPQSAGALATLDGDWALFGVGVAMTPEAGAVARERLDAVVAAMAPWRARRGTYLNFADRPDADPADAFDAATYARLRAIKRAVDPQGTIHASARIAA